MQLTPLGLLGVGLWLTLACHPSSPSPARNAVPASPRSELPFPPTTRAQRAVLAKLEPRAGEQTLLLGLHDAHAEAYQPVFERQAEPSGKSGPGYRTLVLHFAGAAVALNEDLPYLQVPQSQGYLYVGEATAYDNRMGNESDAELERIKAGEAMPHWYLATRLWLTRDRRGIATLARRLQESLLREQQWGTLDCESVGYVTPRLLVLNDERLEWTGGALALRGADTVELQSLGDPIDPTVLARHGRAELERVAKLIIADYQLEPEQFEGVEKPLRLPFGARPSLTTDLHLCLTRFEGQVWEAGCILLPGSSGHGGTQTFRIRPASADLAPSNVAPLDFAAVRRAWPDAVDVLVTPNQAFVLILGERGLSVIHVSSAQEVLTLGSAHGRIVMAEWVPAGDANTP